MKKNCISPTGCIHTLVIDTHRVATLCNHFIGSVGYEYDWLLTDKPVTCKRCLAIINRRKYSDEEMFDFLETRWATTGEGTNTRSILTELMKGYGNAFTTKY